MTKFELNAELLAKKLELSQLPRVSSYSFSEDADDQGYAAELIAAKQDLRDEIADIEAQIAAIPDNISFDGRGNKYVNGLRYVNDEVGYVDEDEEYY